MCLFIYLYIYIYIHTHTHLLIYYVHFWANTLRKGMNPLILPAMG